MTEFSFKGQLLLYDMQKGKCILSKSEKSILRQKKAKYQETFQPNKNNYLIESDNSDVIYGKRNH